MSWRDVSGLCVLAYVVHMAQIAADDLTHGCSMHRTTDSANRAIGRTIRIVLRLALVEISGRLTKKLADS
jgi:hypothetical protein